MSLFSDWFAGPLDYAEVTPQVAVGSAFAPRRTPQLQKRGVTAVVDCRAEACDDATRLESAGLQLRRIPIRDHHAPPVADLLDAVEWVLEHLARTPHARVFVHCQEGIGRGPLVASSVLVAQGYPVAMALNAVRTARPRVALNERQLALLRSFAVAWRERTPGPQTGATPESVSLSECSA